MKYVIPDWKSLLGKEHDKDNGRFRILSTYYILKIIFVVM